MGSSLSHELPKPAHRSCSPSLPPVAAHSNDRLRGRVWHPGGLIHRPVLTAAAPPGHSQQASIDPGTSPTTGSGSNGSAVVVEHTGIIRRTQ